MCKGDVVCCTVVQTSWLSFENSANMIKNDFQMALPSLARMIGAVMAYILEAFRDIGIILYLRLLRDTLHRVLGVDMSKVAPGLLPGCEFFNHARLVCVRPQ